MKLLKVIFDISSSIENHTSYLVPVPLFVLSFPLVPLLLLLFASYHQRYVVTYNYPLPWCWQIVPQYLFE